MLVFFSFVINFLIYSQNNNCGLRVTIATQACMPSISRYVISDHETAGFRNLNRQYLVNAWRAKRKTGIF